VAVAAEDSAKNSGVRWNFRDSTWQARCRRPDGTWLTKTKSVHARIASERDPLINCDFEIAKKTVYDELDEWMNSEQDLSSEMTEHQH
jgi:hypothetical protein